MSLAIKGLTLSYGNVRVLHELSFHFQDAEICAIIGPNGSGKSSLLRCINRLVIPQDGCVLLNGTLVSDLSSREIAQQFGYVPQNFQDTFPATVMETILMGRRPYASWRSGRNDIMKASEVMRLLHLEHFALRYHSELSGGQRQKVMIARAFAQDCSVLLFDEPTSQLDIRHQLEIMDLVTDTVRSKKILAIIVIHDLNLAARYADRILMLSNGNIFAYGTPKNVLTKENIQHVYGVESLVMHDGDVPCITPKCRIIF